MGGAAMVGRTLGHYRILDELGKGGMGEVYRARDEVLGRDVAIKVLPEGLTQDPERLARFEREAKVLASVNHPHIAQIYSFEAAGLDADRSDEEVRFLVIELVEGETLAEKLALHPMPVEEATAVAIQIAQALEAAHEKGIVHRDLKPANIKVTSGGEVKVLDFGLAKPSEATFQGNLNESPTLTYAPTGKGVLMGTAAYMSPEQVRGQEVDKRSDIWAFGVVLWEMLTGKKLFGGDTISDILASTLMREPDWQGLPEGLPPAVVRVLKRCLVQDPKARLHDIADARIELQEALEEPEVPLETVVTPKPLWLRAAPWLVLPLALALGWFLRPVPEPEPVPTVRFEIPLPEGERLTHYHRHGIAWSPDGSTLAFESGTATDVLIPERTQIYLRKLDSWEARPIAGTESSAQPIFSPDGQWLAFSALTPDFRLLLRKIPVGGGEPETLCECDASLGASWGPDDTIVFGSSSLSGLQQVSTQGGTPETLTTLNLEAGEVRHILPHHLPGGDSILFTVSVGDVWGASSVHIKSLSDGRRRLLIAEGSDARYVPTGHLVYVREGKLFAIHFDLDHLEVAGPEVPVLEGVIHSTHLGSDGWETLAAQYSLSSLGSLAYAKGSVFPEMPLSWVFVDRQGRTDPLEIEPKQYLTVRVNRDQRRLLLTTSYPPIDAWIYDLERGTLTRQTFDEETSFAIWGPGPDEITFSSSSEGAVRIYWKTVNEGPEGAKPLMAEHETTTGEYPGSWTSDGTALAFVADPAGSEPNMDIWTFSGETGVAEPFVHSEFREMGPEFSPDGRWLAYCSDESGGQMDVYVRPYPGPGASVQISIGGGGSPAWSQDGREIFYRSGWPVQFFAVPVDTRGDRLTAGIPQVLFEGEFMSATPIRSYEVLADGRFVLLLPTSDADNQAAVETVFPTRIRVVQSWLAEIEAKMPR